MNKFIISIFLSVFLISGSLRPNADRFAKLRSITKKFKNKFIRMRENACFTGFFASGYSQNGRGTARRYEWLLDEKISLIAPKLADDPFSFFSQNSRIEVMQKELDKYPGKKKLLIGLCGGAALTINMAVNPDVKAVIAESSYDHVKVWWKGIPLIERIFCGKQPIDFVKDIPIGRPILLICTKEDLNIPWESTKRLYKKFRLTGHDNVHILILEKGKHAKLVYRKKEDELQKYGAIPEYRPVVHAFLKKYGLPYNKKLAKKGLSRFEECQPNVEDSGG